MARHIFRSNIFLTAMLAASAVFAGADIVECVDQHGRVTLTDAPCGEGARSIVTPGVAGQAIERVVPGPAQGRHGRSRSPLPGARMLARDAETLRAARVSMHVLDAASAKLRHQRVAGLD